MNQTVFLYELKGLVALVLEKDAAVLGTVLETILKWTDSITINQLGQTQFQRLIKTIGSILQGEQVYDVDVVCQEQFFF